jgi:uncharacterized protein (TIGR03084 family)
MIEEAEFFRAESEALDQVVRASDLSPSDPTLFKSWTTDQILRHLHFWNEAALLSLKDADGFAAMLQDAMPVMATEGIRAYEDRKLGDMSGDDLRELWNDGVQRTADAFAAADPDARLPWAGPPMTARSSISARLMESWAHGQAVYDARGIDRQEHDRIHPIAELGVRTFGWTYQVRGERRPPIKPYVRLQAPSGAVWTFNDERDDERIEGLASEFCRVVTQTRNIADTHLKLTGDIARDWMSKAQCFAGMAETPPAPGLRKKAGKDTA